jgi:ATP-dependent Clp protease ATP-binding subunit ClpC
MGVPCEVAWSGGGIAGVGPVSRPFTDRARRVVVLAQDEARLLNHDYLGTEHLLLGLIGEGEGVAAQVLMELGADLSSVRQRVIELLSGAAGS